MNQKPEKYSITITIYNKDRSKVLAVKRPSDDERLPDVWGLPAGSLMHREISGDAVLRAGEENLGVELKIIKPVGEDEVEREKHLLHMKVFEAEIINGTPKVPQPVKGITQYQDWKWAIPDELKDGARKGSLCCRVFLSNLRQGW